MASAVDAIATNRGFWDTAKKVGNTYMNFSFGCGQDQKFVESIFGRNEQKIKMGFKDAWKEAKLGESWWQSFKDAFTPSKMSQEWKLYREGAEGVKAAGKFRSTGRFLLKRMPFIGNAIGLAFAAPNIYRAFTDKENGGGVGTGLKEAAKEGVKFTTFAAGAALGALVPGIGFITALAGGYVAGLIADKILGKSFTDKKEEAEAEKAQKAQQAQQAQQPLQTSGQSGGTQGAGGMQQQFTNPYGQGGNSNNIFQSDWKDKDIMAMSVGLA